MATVMWDFDGVLHRYSRGWHDGTVYDPPMPGAVDALRQSLDLYATGVFTTRVTWQVIEWLQRLGFDATDDDTCRECRGEKLVVGSGGLDECPACSGEGVLTFWNERGRVLVTNRKLPAIGYVDDRAVKFDGDFDVVFGALDDLA